MKYFFKIILFFVVTFFSSCVLEERERGVEEAVVVEWYKNLFGGYGVKVQTANQFGGSPKKVYTTGDVDGYKLSIYYDVDKPSKDGRKRGRALLYVRQNSEGSNRVESIVTGIEIPEEDFLQVDSLAELQKLVERGGRSTIPLEILEFMHFSNHSSMFARMREAFAEEGEQQRSVWDDFSVRGVSLGERQKWDGIEPFVEGLARVQKDGKYGVIDFSGEVVLLPEWDGVGALIGECFLVRKEKKFGLIHLSGEIIADVEWDSIANKGRGFVEGLVQASKAGKHGFINEGGEVIVEPEWDCIWNFHQGFARVNKGGKMIYHPSERQFYFRGGLWGFVDSQGEVVIEPKWNKVWDFYEGFALVKEGGKFGYINQQGEVVIDFQWDDAWYFSEGLARVKKDGKWGFINQDGKIVSAPQWDWVGSFDQGLAKVEKDGQIGYIDSLGEIVSWGEERPDLITTQP